MSEKKTIVVVGAGFAGINAAKVLARDEHLQVIIIDKKNHHLFQPLLYQVATAGLSPADIASPIRSIVRPYQNVKVVLGEVTDVNFAQRLVKTHELEFSYDYLVLACGAQHSYFGHPEWEEFAPGLKTIEHAVEIRRRILMAYEKAEIEKDQNVQRALLTFVVVGGGPTGVELAGAIAEISRKTLEKDFRQINPASTRVILIEAGSRVLTAFSSALSRRATRDLERLGVQIWTGTRVTGLSQNRVELGGETLNASTILWAAGVEPSAIGRKLKLPLDHMGRVEIDSDLRVKGFENVFVLGDQAAFKTTEGTLPGLAPVAIQQGRWAAKNILRLKKNQQTLPFRYVDKGIMATIGKRKAIMEAFGLEVTGLFAWLAWLVIHIYYLIGFKNRFFVFLQWAWQYITSSKGARLISSPNWREVKSDSENLSHPEQSTRK